MFERSKDIEKKNQGFNNDEVFIKRNPPKDQAIKGLYEIFLAYFDETMGHLPLFTYPANLKTDKEECRIISIHSIWWMNTEKQKDLEHVNLEYAGRNYLATKFKAKSFREKTRSGLLTETPETFVLILSVPVHLTQFGIVTLNMIFEKIQELKDDLYILINKEIACVKPLKTPIDKENIVKGIEIENTLKKICEESIPEITPDVLKTLVNVDNVDQENLAFLLLDDLHLLEPGTREFDVSQDETKIERPGPGESEVFKRKIEISDISLMDNDQKLKITVKNISVKNLKNITIRITHIQEFFEAASWNTIIDEWYPDEELIFQYPRIFAENNDEYMLRIEDQTTKLVVKKISAHDFKPKGDIKV
ncbi:MAG TPA: hypothetical protein VMV49_02700 [Candidatus Deferrimicrobium sp.]|nr:hypothetical protein [Candidatus Deferrimicrobium sp.]